MHACVCMRCVGTHAVANLWRSEDSLVESAVSYLYVHSWNQTQMVRFVQQVLLPTEPSGRARPKLWHPRVVCTEHTWVMKKGDWDWATHCSLFSQNPDSQLALYSHSQGTHVSVSFLVCICCPRWSIWKALPGNGVKGIFRNIPSMPLCFSMRTKAEDVTFMGHVSGKDYFA